MFRRCSQIVGRSYGYRLANDAIAAITLSLWHEKKNVLHAVTKSSVHHHIHFKKCYNKSNFNLIESKQNIFAFDTFRKV